MTVTEFDQAILSRLRREPFEPFEIELAHGQVLPVEYPEMVGVGYGLASWGHDASDLVLFDYTNTIRIGGAAPARA